MAEATNKTKRIKLPEMAKICIIDDDKFVVELLVRSLNMAGFSNIKIYDNGEAFIDDFEANNDTEMLISDIVLPGMSGFELCQKVKQKIPAMLVILISGFNIEDIHAKVLDSGADDFIAKPFNPIELNTRVKLHLAKLEKANSSIISAKEQARHPSNMPFVGDSLGKYIITDTIGWGKSSFIFKVSKKGSNEFYTLKILASHAISLSNVAFRFKKEVGIMKKIKHPNIVTFVDEGEYNSIPYVVMEYIRGLDLEEFLITKGRIPIQDGLAIAHGISSAIAQLHFHNVIHRDIKLKNIIFDTFSKSPKLIDFGIAKEADSPHITRDGFVLGTPIYMAPEIFEGEEATVKSDIYSFGATIYHLLTSSPPFVGESARDLYKKHLADFPLPIKSFRDDVTEDVDRLICIECLAKNPSYRPSSMKEVEERLKEYIKHLK